MHAKKLLTAELAEKSEFAERIINIPMAWPSMVFSAISGFSLRSLRLKAFERQQTISSASQ
jgi:hypothetical protein